MAVVIDATIAGTNSNSYCTLAEADTYISERLYTTAWEAADTATKNVALVMATRLLDSMFIWDESTYTTTLDQALQWPRIGMLAANRQEDVGDYEIPRELKWAEAELARQLLASDRTADSDIETLGINSLSAGPVSLSFNGKTTAKVVPDAVAYLMPPWWFTIRGKQLGIRPLVRA